MIKIGIGDWFLARSEGFRLLLIRLRDHKINVQRSFSRIKSKHKEIDERIDELESKIRRLEKILKEMEYEPQIIRKKR